MKHGCCSRLWLYMGQSVHGGSAIHPKAARGGRRACSRVADHGKRLEESPGLGFQSSRVEGSGCKGCRQTLWHLTRAGRLPGAKQSPTRSILFPAPPNAFPWFHLPLGQARRSYSTLLLRSTCQAHAHFPRSIVSCDSLSTLQSLVARSTILSAVWIDIPTAYWTLSKNLLTARRLA